jgi:hypothetical protein
VRADFAVPPAAVVMTEGALGGAVETAIAAQRPLTAPGGATCS